MKANHGDGLTAAQSLVRQLQINGVERVFCVPGESYLAVLDALCDAPEIQVVTCRHEGGATMMAEAYGKLTGKPGIAFVTRGPGATNASAGIHVAHQDSTPLILFVGDVERQGIHRDCFQEIDFETMFKPITKWVMQIEDGNRMPELVSRAFHTATAGRPGPVVLSLHEDMLTETVKVAPARAWAPINAAPSAEAVQAVADKIAAARQPVIVTGGGGWSKAASAAIQHFAESWELPVVNSFRCQDFVDNRSPSYIGNLGLGANPALLRLIEESDLLVLIGARFGEITSNSYTLLDIPTPRQEVIHIHADPEELGRIYQPVLGINCDSTSMAKALAAFPAPASRPWAAALPGQRENYLAWTTPGKVHGDVQMGEIMTWLRETLPENAIVTNGAGNFAIWPNRFYRYRGYGTMLAPRSGSMGYGLPAAISAKLAHPDRDVVCFAGDGDFMMTGNELATAVMYNVPVITIILNNSLYGTIRMHQERHYPFRISATELRNPDFAALAKSYGAHGEKVTRTEEFFPAFERARASGLPAVIEVVIEPELLSPTETISSLRAKASK
mgnify:CR=1 FL=1